jgi:hypothetical protein
MWGKWPFSDLAESTRLRDMLDEQKLDDTKDNGGTPYYGGGWGGYGGYVSYGGGKKNKLSNFFFDLLNWRI